MSQHADLQGALEVTRVSLEAMAGPLEQPTDWRGWSLAPYTEEPLGELAVPIVEAAAEATRRPDMPPNPRIDTFLRAWRDTAGRIMEVQVYDGGNEDEPTLNGRFIAYTKHAQPDGDNWPATQIELMLTPDRSRITGAILAFGSMGGYEAEVQPLPGRESFRYSSVMSYDDRDLQSLASGYPEATAPHKRSPAFLGFVVACNTLLEAVGARSDIIKAPLD
jgi:hypothetical protein